VLNPVGTGSLADLLDGPPLEMPRNASSPNLVATPLQPAAPPPPTKSAAAPFDPFADLGGGLTGSLSSQNLRGPSLPMNATAGRSGSGTLAGTPAVGSQNLLGRKIKTCNYQY
jgi:hypothetical protein